MMNENVLAKLKILAESAKYDVSCSSSGTVRSNKPGTLGNTVGGWGICHSFAEDGRCISLLKIMLTNYCIYDCAYCVNRRSNDLPRATFSVSELVELTMEFYRRNYIEGLFLSSGVVRNPDYTMERLVRVAKDLRQVYRFNGYIHLKSIPGASRELVNEAGLYADRLSVNVEIPKEENLKLLAPEKDHKSVFAPMKYIQQGVLESKEERQKFRHAPRFAPAGQSTQVIVGATSESDKDILFLSSALYGRPTMKRVYYSGYVSVNTYDKRLPALKQPPLVRENRLYQADWLLRFYQFKVDEIVDELEKLPEVAAYYAAWNGLRDTLEGYYKSTPRQHNPLSQQKEFRAIKNAIIQEAERLRQQMEHEHSSEETSTDASTNPTLANENTSSTPSCSVRLPSDYLLDSTIRLFHQMGQIFRDNAVPPSNPMGIRVDSKRRRKLMQKRLAMGHKQDDHEQEQGYNLDIR